MGGRDLLGGIEEGPRVHRHGVIESRSVIESHCAIESDRVIVSRSAMKGRRVIEESVRVDGHGVFTRAGPVRGGRACRCHRLRNDDLPGDHGDRLRRLQVGVGDPPLQLDEASGHRPHSVGIAEGHCCEQVGELRELSGQPRPSAQMGVGALDP